MGWKRSVMKAEEPDNALKYQLDAQFPNCCRGTTVFCTILAVSQLFVLKIRLGQHCGQIHGGSSVSFWMAQGNRQALPGLRITRDLDAPLPFLWSVRRVQRPPAVSPH